MKPVSWSFLLFFVASIGVLGPPLDAQPGVVEVCSQPGTPISDTTGPVFESVFVPDAFFVADVQVCLDLTHTFVGDLVVQLQSPFGTFVELHTQQGGPDNDLVLTYSDQGVPSGSQPFNCGCCMQPAGPGSMADLTGDSFGEWILFVADVAGGDDGVLNEWCLQLSPNPSTGCAPCGATSTVIPAGPDCWGTQCGRTRFSFCEFPIPADFFDPGSLPFEGVVHLEGASGGVSPDTVVQRLQDMDLPNPGDVATTEIELVELNLVGCAPITVQTGGSSEEWLVGVGLAPNPVPPGQMTVTKTHPNGGVFSAEFFVQPIFTFTRVSNPTDVRVLEAPFPAPFTTVGEAPWVGALQPGLSIPCAPGFVPGVEEDPATGDQCCKKVGHAGPGHIHETGPPDCSACDDGACMDPVTLACTVVTSPADCTGVFLGVQTDCTDSDGDGLPDSVETNDCCVGFIALTDTGTDPFNPDSDGDGVLDGDEILAGTDPCSPPDPAIPPGEDCWSTACGRTKFSFCETPIPADFFDPGSEPFIGVIKLDGANGPGGTDTRLNRLEEMVLPNPGDVATTPIELVELNLVSCDPITVQTGGTDVEWNVSVTLSPDPVPMGTMTVTKTHENGGTFDAEFFVKPVFTFTRVTDLSDVRTLEPAFPAPFVTLGEAPWVSDLLPGVATPCAPGFTPGVEEDPATGDQCCKKVGHAGPGHIHETGPPDCSACDDGACLDPVTLDCIVVTNEAACSDVFLGVQTDCADSDGDGLPDVVETNDCCAGGTGDLTDTGTDPFNADSDGDGIDDGTEMVNGLDPCDSTPLAFIAMDCNVDSFFDIAISWVAHPLATYDGVEVRVDGITQATLPGDATSHTISGATGTVTVCVIGLLAGSASPELCCTVTVGSDPQFTRGDCNGDGSCNIADAIGILAFLFTAGVPTPGCLDACDLNDDSGIDIGDAIVKLNLLFSTGTPPAPPYPDCGVDPTTSDPLDCVSSPCP